MKIAIIGAGATARVVADIILESHTFRIAGFVGSPGDEKTFADGRVYHDIPFLGDHSVLPKLNEIDVVGFIVAIGDDFIREKVYYEALQAELSPVNAISPRAAINADIIIGAGTAISPGVTIGSGVNIGNNVIIFPGAVIGADVNIGDHCCLKAGAIVSVGSTIEKNARLGVGAVVDSVTVGKNQDVPTGTVVRESLPGLYRKEAD